MNHKVTIIEFYVVTIILYAKVRSSSTCDWICSEMLQLQEGYKVILDITEQGLTGTISTPQFTGRSGLK